LSAQTNLFGNKKMLNLDKKIWRKFKIKSNDNLPYCAKKADRNTLALFFSEMNFNYGAEIGVRRGSYSKILCEANPKLKIVCIDPWAPYAEANLKKQNKNYETAKNILRKYKAQIYKKTSMEAIDLFENNSFDFVYIDAAHNFDNVMTDIIYWEKKVKPGGILAGHDYFHMSHNGVVFAINAYTRAHDIKYWYITSEQYPSWFWVKR